MAFVSFEFFAYVFCIFQAAIFCFFTRAAAVAAVPPNPTTKYSARLFMIHFDTLPEDYGKCELYFHMEGDVTASRRQMYTVEHDESAQHVASAFIVAELEERIGELLVKKEHTKNRQLWAIVVNARKIPIYAVNFADQVFPCMVEDSGGVEGLVRLFHPGLRLTPLGPSVAGQQRAPHKIGATIDDVDFDSAAAQPPPPSFRQQQPRDVGVAAQATLGRCKASDNKRNGFGVRTASTRVPWLGARVGGGRGGAIAAAFATRGPWSSGVATQTAAASAQFGIGG